MIRQAIIGAAALMALPAAVRAAPFDGPFVGVQAGWQQDHDRLRVDGDSDRFGIRQAGVAYGAQAGYDYKLSPHFVLGVEASATGRSTRERITDADDNEYRLKIGRTFGASGRLGYLVTPASLVYARSGYANARFTLDSPIDRTSVNRNGYVAGVGYEQAITRAVSARVEYDYSNFGHDNLRSLASDLDVDSAEAKYDRNAVTAGVNFHF